MNTERINENLTGHEAYEYHDLSLVDGGHDGFGHETDEHNEEYVRAQQRRMELAELSEKRGREREPIPQEMQQVIDRLPPLTDKELGVDYLLGETDEAPSMRSQILSNLTAHERGIFRVAEMEREQDFDPEDPLRGAEKYLALVDLAAERAAARGIDSSSFRFYATREPEHQAVLDGAILLEQQARELASPNLTPLIGHAEISHADEQLAPEVDDEANDYNMELDMD